MLKTNNLVNINTKDLAIYINSNFPDIDYSMIKNLYRLEELELCHLNQNKHHLINNISSLSSISIDVFNFSSDSPVIQCFFRDIEMFSCLFRRSIH